MSYGLTDKRGDPMLRDVMTARVAGRCICGKRMLELFNEGTCLWCGHGRALRVIEHAYRLNAERNTAPKGVAQLRSPRQHGWQRWSEEDCIDAARAWEDEYGHLPTSAEWIQKMNGFHRPSYGTIHSRFGGWGAFLQAIAEVPREQVEVAAA